MSGILMFSPPVMAITGLAIAAGRFARGRLATRGRLIALAALLLLCAGLGVAGCLETSAEVPSSQAVSAGLIAGIGLGLLPLGFFYAIGYLLRSAWVTAVAWVVCSLPVATYGLLVLLGLAAQSCPPGASDCPI